MVKLLLICCFNPLSKLIQKIYQITLLTKTAFFEFLTSPLKNVTKLIKTGLCSFSHFQDVQKSAFLCLFQLINDHIAPLAALQVSKIM